MEQPLARAAREKRLDLIGQILYFVFLILGLTSAFGYIHPIIGIASIYCAFITGYYTKPQNQKLTTFQKEYLDKQDSSTQQAINRIEKWHTHIYYALVSLAVWIILSAGTYDYYNDLLARLLIAIRPQYKWIISHNPEAATRLLGISCLFISWLVVSLIVKYIAGSYYQQWREYYTNGRSNNRIKVTNALYVVVGLTCVALTLMQSNSVTIITDKGVVDNEFETLSSHFYSWNEIERFDPDRLFIVLDTKNGGSVIFMPDKANRRSIERFISDRTGLKPYNDQ